MSLRLTRTGAAGAVTLALVIVPLTASPAFSAEETRTLQLLNINDFHGRISTDIGMGLAGTIQAQRAENPNTLLLSAGDNVSASLYVSSVQDDAPTIDYLNALGLQASATGNHEYDRGLDDLQNRLSNLAQFPYLAANVTDKNTGEPVSDPFVILEAPDGTKVAVIGTVTQETPQLTDPSALAGVNFGDPVQATNRYAAQLSDGDESNGEADVIVAEYHEGVNTAAPESDPIITGTSPAVDVIFTGHTHEEYVIDAPVPGEPGTTRPVLQTGNYGDNLGDVTLTLDSQNKVVGYEATLHERGAVPSAEQIAADPVLAETNRILNEANAYAEEQGNVAVAPLDGKITTGWDAAQQDSKGGFDQRNLESTMGHLVADMYLSAANSTGRTPADIGIVNPGGLRDEFPAGLRNSLATEAGTLTVADIVSVAPFANNLWTTQLTGAQLRQVLEEQWQQDATGAMATRPYLQLGLSSNVTYTYTGSPDAEGYATRGSNIDEIYVNGKKVQDSDTFTVAIPSFLLGGGDNFTTLSQGTNAQDTALVDSDAFIAYLQGMDSVAPRFEKQAVRVADLADTYDLSGNLTFSLSDLNTRSYDVPELTALDVMVDGIKVGTVEVASGATTVDLPLANLGIGAGEHEILLTDPTGVVGTEVRLSANFTAEAAEAPGAEVPNQDDAAPAPDVQTPAEDGAAVAPTVPEAQAPATDDGAAVAPAAPAGSTGETATEITESAEVAAAESSSSEQQTGTHSAQKSDSPSLTTPQAEQQNSSGGVLASTGFSGLQLALASAAVVALGAIMVMFARRPKKH
ncbi:bifunctional metallophosphatase/5'-nucleotidase [Rothia aerolata]|uniref:Bifunctional metallophosphatase/5'-nucleotidase n=1 Tax=Rothia aerolata TaxID=1812262 RepID=A0A917IXY1_9MICC|nr:bifunctional UDP-sugar hydrolase/5'-nucleotidase [Rothia aerolata]GGH67054.1 hypothetical protein GCM10007359_21800 [Rothia aerolata]